MRKVYLSGASKNVAEDISSSWREYVSVALGTDFNTFNPNKHYDYKEYLPASDKECRKLFLNHLRESDILLVNLDFSEISCGTNYEIGFAQALNKPIIGFGKIKVYPWARDACDIVLDDMVSAVNYITTHYWK